MWTNTVQTLVIVEIISCFLSDFSVTNKILKYIQYYIHKYKLTRGFRFLEIFFKQVVRNIIGAKNSISISAPET